ncbi:MAG: exodeoxyribonuclease VII large subunit [Proteobacteria bacterium]|nr:exodeoxyribonuclease VII large subunit [Pseudomonadota bacterium]RZO98708.1 MAG: exodeoxyribonuclease VII large subunit [Gammaproteobacteria bacterium]|tara:strand:+ start:3010 stop:4362 length:1353 start_codon:yes stop_codon:yes gene_type:complete
MQDSNQKNNLDILSVSDLNNSAKRLLEKNYSSIWIQGEVTNFRSYDSGHWYFKVKDDNSEIQCVMFRFRNNSANMKPSDGDQVVLNGSISMYVAKGSYQFQVDSIEYAGEGVLLKSFEALKKRLQNDGFFDEETKLNLPHLPQHIAVISSANGAVIQDIRNVINRRAPLIDITLIPALVQGDGSEESLLNALTQVKKLNDLKKVNALILARGGGSLEDLWSFNSEKLAMEIFKLQIPTISAIGHETDFTICDFVSDLRAPTPSAAAEIISESYLEKFAELTEISNLLGTYFKNVLNGYDNKLKIIQKSLINPKTKIFQNHQKLDEYENLLNINIKGVIVKLKNNIALSKSELSNLSPLQNILIRKKELQSNQNILLKIMDTFIELKKERFSRLIGEMNSLSPLNVLSRGYSITNNKKTGKIIRNQNDVSPGDVITTKVSETLFDSKVIKS